MPGHVQAAAGRWPQDEGVMGVLRDGRLDQVRILEGGLVDHKVPLMNLKLI